MQLWLNKHDMHLRVVLAVLLSVHQLSAKPVEVGVEEVDECFATYLAATAECSSVYESNYRQCHAAVDTQKQLCVDQTNDDHSVMIEEQMRRLQQIRSDCEQLEDDLAYFQCQVDHGANCLQALRLIEASARYALIDLNSTLSAAEKEALECEERAHKQYQMDMWQAHNELTTCLDAAQIKNS